MPYNKIQKIKENKIDYKKYLSIHDGEKEAASNIEGGSIVAIRRNKKG